nr:uncharacterized protein LOC105718167 [Aotus nancymaae]
MSEGTVGDLCPPRGQPKGPRFPSQQPGQPRSQDAASTPARCSLLSYSRAFPLLGPLDTARASHPGIDGVSGKRRSPASSPPGGERSGLGLGRERRGLGCGPPGKMPSPARDSGEPPDCEAGEGSP